MPILLRSTFAFLAVCVFGGALGVSFLYAADEPSKKKKKGGNAESKQVEEGRNEDRVVILAKTLNYEKSGYYLEDKSVLAIDPDKDREAKVSFASSLPNGKYNIIVKAIGEDDGESRFTIAINGDRLKEQKCRLAKKSIDADPRFWLTWSKIEIDSGDIVEVRSVVHSKNGDDSSRGRWSAIVFEPADDKTRLALKERAKPSKESQVNSKSSGSKVTTSNSASPAKPESQAQSASKAYPKHWGEPPAIQTRDLVPLPEGFGMGSSTLRKWIQANLDRDAAKASAKTKPTEPSVTSPSKNQASESVPAPPTLPRKPVVQAPRQANGNGSVSITGELKQWYKATLTLDGPFAHEQDFEPNPFTDYRMSVTFKHESGFPVYEVLGYFAADGKAGESSADGGTKWRAHFVPDQVGRWMYTVHFSSGKNVAFDSASGSSWKPYDGIEGRILVEPSTKTGRDFRAHGRLKYVGKRYLQFAGTNEYFLKVGADSPETLLAYEDFDNTVAGKGPKAPLKSYTPHLDDWRSNDPSWKNGKGKGLIGALNYLADQGLTGFLF